MQKTIYPVLFTFCCLGAQAQSVTGKVLTDPKTPAVGATVELLRLPDSSLLLRKSTDAQGLFAMTATHAGKYGLRVSYVGYQPALPAVVELSRSKSLELPPIVLQPEASTGLQQVVVQARKPLYEVRADRTIMNVEGTANAIGSDAMELLRKAPGIMVDRDDNLVLSGKSGLQVYIDGRPSPLSGADLAAMLRGMQASQIEAIEIITNPSARYDAAGNAGIINIRLKKDKNLGTNGNLVAGFNQGIYGKYNGSVSLNHRNQKSNWFGSVNANQAKSEFSRTTDRLLLDSFFSQQLTQIDRNTNANLRFGADFFLNKKSTLGFIINAFGNKGTSSTQTFTRIIYHPDQTTDRFLLAANEAENERANLTANLNYKFSVKGKDLTVDADYAGFALARDQYQPNYYLKAGTGEPLYNRIYHMVSPTDIHFLSLKSDYEVDAWKGKLGMGVKSSIVQNDSRFQRYNVLDGEEVLDSLRSNNFLYKENINAAWLNYNGGSGSFSWQAGLRAEHTFVKGFSNGYAWKTGYVPYDSTFTRNYINLFPSVGLTWNTSKQHTWGVTYARRVMRPAYQDLNPFEFKLDEYTYLKGNTMLQPQFAQNLGFLYSWKNMLNIRLNYSLTNDVMAQLVDTTDLTKTFLIKQNLATQQNLSLSINLNITAKWYTASLNLNPYFSHFEADFGPGRTIDLEVWSATGNLQQNAELGKGWKADLYLGYNGPGLWSGTFRQRYFWWMDAGVQKELLQKKMTLRLALTDIAQTQQFIGHSDFAGQRMDVTQVWESRQLKFQLNYRFGSNTVKSARKRTTAGEEQNSRVN